MHEIVFLEKRVYVPHSLCMCASVVLHYISCDYLDYLI